MKSKPRLRNSKSVPGDKLEMLYRGILDNALDCIITIDSGGHVLEFNPAAERTFGFTRQEAIGKELAELIIPPRMRNQHRRGLAHYLKTGEGPVIGRRIEIAGVRKDGSEILVELAITALKIDSAPVFTAYLRDITERVRNDRRRLAQYTVASLLAGSWTLEEASSAILQTITSIGDWVLSGLWVYDETIARLRCRAFWEAGSDKLKQFGQLSKAIQFQMGEGLPGRVWKSNEPAWIYDVTVDKNFPRAPAAREAGLRGGFAFPLFAGRAVNGVIELFSHDFAEPDNDLLQLVTALGSQIGLFIERRRMEKELERAKENAEAASAAKDRFLATLSHELRTPLNPVLLWADGVLNQPGIDPEIEQGLRMVCRNVELEARLIDDLLDLTRIARGKLQLRLQPADAHELIQHAIEIVRADFDSRHIQLSVALEAGSHEVNVDPPRLEQVFWNILRNACKFTADSGAISIRSYNSAPNSITVEMTDNGVGIAPEFLEKIFAAFEQLEMRREGLGLGLAISKAIVEMHGGSIRAQSEGAGKGATFAVTLPVAP
ncbi:MAG TPA: ATP-binding protein [Chthoniobacterales bacterium]|nr:ATP-binding protein [Chthoniobacterales bacterium]